MKGKNCMIVGDAEYSQRREWRKTLYSKIEHIMCALSACIDM